MSTFFGRVPAYWRTNSEREGFRFPVVDRAADYDVVQVGSAMHVIPRLDEPSFMLPKESEKPLYPRRNGHSHDENHPLNNPVIYQVERVKETIG